jgi:peptide/nickel transport system substrate-binding protein
LSPEEAASYLPKLLSGDFDLMLLNIEVGLTSGFTPMYVYAALHSESGSNYIKFNDAEMDRLLVEAMSDPADPAAAWRAVQQRDLEIVPYIPTVTARYVEAYSQRLKGHTPSSLFSLRDLDRSWIAE